MEPNEAIAPDLSCDRSPELMSRHDTALLVVDVQQKLIDRMKHRGLIVWNIGRLIDAAALFHLPTVATEQYPKGLGATVPELTGRLPKRVEKLDFSCCGIDSLEQMLVTQERSKVLVAGIETHVCVLQTAYDLMARGLRVYVAADAVASQRKFDWKWALRRLDSAGAIVTTTEAVLFEWCVTASAPEFKAISQLAKQKAPEQAT